jgi:type I restriction enzyme S subunit
MSVPQGWAVKSLNQLAETALGKMLDRGKNRGLVQVPYLRNVNVQWDSIDTKDLLTMELADEERERFGVHTGDLLVCEGGEVGRAAIWNGRDEYLAYQKALHRIRSRGDVDLKFLRYLLEHYRHNGTLARYSTGSTIAHLPQQRLQTLPVPHPPLREQRRIVEILEDHLSRLDNAKENLKLAGRRVGQLQKSLFWNTTHGLAGAAAAALDQVAEVRLGRQRSPKNHMGERMIPYLRAANVGWNQLRLDDVKSMHFSEKEQVVHTLLPLDILLTEASGSATEVGKSAIYRNEIPGACFQNTLLRVRCYGIAPEFMQKYLLAEAMAGKFMPESRGVGIHHLGRQRLAQWPIEIPPQSEQRAAVDRIEESASAMSRMNVQQETCMRRTSLLRRSLLSAAFSGMLTGSASDADIIKEIAGV